MTDRVERLRRQLRDHRPATPRERRSLRRTIALLDELTDPFDEHAGATHVTGSAIVLDATGRVLLHRHKRLGVWLQPGGHVDPGETCEQAARREVREETGVRAVLASPQPLHVDVHDGPRGHLHLDVRWLLRAEPGAVIAPGPEESPDVAWFAPDEAVAVTDHAAGAAVDAAVRRGEARSDAGQR